MITFYQISYLNHILSPDQKFQIIWDFVIPIDLNEFKNNLGENVAKF